MTRVRVAHASISIGVVVIATLISSGVGACSRDSMSSARDELVGSTSIGSSAQQLAEETEPGRTRKWFAVPNGVDIATLVTPPAGYEGVPSSGFTPASSDAARNVVVFEKRPDREGVEPCQVDVSEVLQPSTVGALSRQVDDRSERLISVGFQCGSHRLN